MHDWHLLALPMIAFAAFYLKAMTGFGPAIVVIAFGSLFIPPHAVIATSSILDFLAGAVLFRGGAKKAPRFLVGLAAALVVGTILGAFILRSIPPGDFRPIFAVAILSIALWFTFFRARSGTESLRADLPERCDRQDIAWSSLGGLLGGMFGISGPPILWHLGRRYRKEAFRGILITVFVVAALTRVISFSIAGLVDRHVLFYVALSLPGQAAGLFFGNRAFFRLSERRFSVIVGVILIAVSLKLFF